MNNLWIDTNVLLRFLTGDPPELAQKALALMKDAEKGKVTLRLSTLIIAEAVWVLSSFYKYEVEQITDIMVSLVEADGIKVNGKNLVVRALTQMSSKNVDFIDAYLAEAARNAGEPVCSFDQDFDRLGVARISP
jgi:predicted nucleic-acid-binding protein